MEQEETGEMLTGQTSLDSLNSQFAGLNPIQHLWGRGGLGELHHGCA